MDKIFINDKQVEPTSEFDLDILKDISWSSKSFNSHEEIAKELKNKEPYLVSIYIENLKWELRHRKEYVKLTKEPISTLYHELLFKNLYEEFGDDNVNDIYGKWLDKYERNDDLILKKEIEPRYKAKILAKYKNHTKLFKSRVRHKRERYYNLPKPLDWVDWRTLFDNLFIWQNDNNKYARRGGSGSSGARETNSMFMYALMELNKENPIPSYLMVYTDDNKLKLIKKFNSLTLPNYDIGSNYQIDSKVSSELKKNTKLLEWKSIFKPTHLIVK